MGILNTCTWLWLTESEQVTSVDSITDIVRSFVKVPEFDKHLKKAGGHIGRNVVEITMKMKTIVRIPSMIKIIKFRRRNLDNKYIYGKLLLYSHLHVHAASQWHYNYDAMTKTHEGRKTQEDFFTIIYTSHFICKGSKGLFKGCMWEGVGERT